MIKQMVWIEQDTFDPVGSAKSLIDQLQWCVDTYGDNIRIERRNYQYEDGHYYAIESLVEETDIEYAHRISAEKSRAKRNEARELAEFARLQEKYKETK
jgi:hypothetical protein